MASLEIAPGAALQEWVECFWWRRSEGESGAVHRILPDGAADLIFDLSGDTTDSSDTFAVGTMTRPLIVPAGVGEFLGVRFRPGGAAAFFGMPMGALTDARAPIRDIVPHFDRSLAARLASERTLAARIELVRRELMRRLRDAGGPDPSVAAAVRLLVRSGGNARIDLVASHANLTRQHLRRRFVDAVGVSPKVFARIVRFRRLHEALRQRRLVSWSDLALKLGYYDQSHMIQEFRVFAGTTPKKFHSSYR